MTVENIPFAMQGKVRGPWRRYLDSLEPLRPDLHRYCCGLTGNVWDGEDLVQDVLLRVFGLLGKIDAKLRNPRAYLIRTATHLWIDRMRRRTLEHQWMQQQVVESPEAEAVQKATDSDEVAQAAGILLSRLSPQERAAILLKDVYDFSLTETASMLKTTEGAVKSALSGGRERLKGSRQSRRTDAPSAKLVEEFTDALSANVFHA